MMARPWPASTQFWIGDTVYKKHGSKNAGHVLGVSLDGCPALPMLTYNVSWPKEGVTDYSYEMELTSEKPSSFKEI